MAVFRLPFVKSLVSSLSGISRSSSAQFCRPLSSSISSVNLQRPNVERNVDNIVSSRHDDCTLHDLTITQRFFDQASVWPNNIAVECGITGRKYTYDKVRDLSRRFGSALVRMGFQRGEVFGMVLPNLPEFPIVMFGAAGIGMPVTTVNPIYTADEIARQMQGSGATAIICVPQMTETIREVARLCPTIRRMIVIGSEEGFVSIGDMFQDPGDYFNDNIEMDAREDIFVLPFSSGTTGLPKGVMLTHFNVNSNISQLRVPGTLHLKDCGLANFQEVFVCVLPFFHIYGMVAVMLVGFDLGAKLVTLPRFDTDSFLNTVHLHHPTVLHLVPPLVSFLGHNKDWKKEAFHRLHTICCGAAPLGAAAATKLMDRLNIDGCILQEGFGMTESSPVSHMGPISNYKIGSCGELVSRTLAKIVDINTGEALGPNQEGELCVFGPQVMKGYYNNEKATQETVDTEGWLHTGDIAIYDEDNQFFIVDRLKELIKVKGLQVAPSELEDLLRRHPAVLDVAVIGVEDEMAGELPRAYIVLKKNHAGTSTQEIRNFIAPQVAAHKQLKGGVVFIDSIPTSATGKLLRRELKAQLSQYS